MSKKGFEISLDLADKVADKFLNYIRPCCSQLSIAGSVRRRKNVVGDIEVVAVPKDEFCMGRLFPDGYPGLTINGTRLKRFIYEQLRIQIELYLTSPQDYGRILAIRTGSSAFSHHLAMRWNRLGFCGTEDGLRKKSECIRKSTWKIKPEYKANPTLPPVFSTEEEFFAFLGVEWVDPIRRSWVSKNNEYNYSL